MISLLTPDEDDVLLCYRAMSDEAQGAARVFLRTLAVGNLREERTPLRLVAENGVPRETHCMRVGDKLPPLGITWSDLRFAVNGA